MGNASSVFRLLALPALAIASVVSGACSDGPKSSDRIAVPVEALSLRTQSTPATATTTSQSDSGATVAMPDQPWAAAIALPPSTRCAVHPEGVSNDPTRNNTVYAGADGELRFFLAPPQAQVWGTRLTLECTLNGSSQGNYLVDLNDRSTFKMESQSDLVPSMLGTRPALSSNVSTIGSAQLFQQGYPPQPDPNKSPAMYALWEQIVNTPMDQYSTVPVALLGVQATVGTFDGSTPSTAWTGFVQASDGFQTEPHYGLNLFANLNGAQYDEFAMETFAPYATCPALNCSYNYMWGGIGGYPTYGFGSDFTPQLLQGGFFTGPNAPEPIVDLFVEFVGGSVGGDDNQAPIYWSPPDYGHKFASGDEFAIWGFAGNATCGAFSSPPSLGCFLFIDQTNNWYQLASVPSPVDTNGKPVGTWWPVTAEYINEKAGMGLNPNYGANVAVGYALDTAGNEHLDPGNAGPGNTSGKGDPYILQTQFDSNLNTCATAEWYNGTGNIPYDPMTFIEKTNPFCGPL